MVKVAVVGMKSRIVLLLLAFGERTLGILEVLLEESLDDAFPGVDEPVIDLVDSEFGLAGHLLLLHLRGVGIVEVLQQPLLHDARRLQGDLAVLPLTAVLLLDLLLLLQLLPRTTQPTDQVAGVALDYRLQICHFLGDLPEW
jgi:hypothetical protein